VLSSELITEAETNDAISNDDFVQNARHCANGILSPISVGSDLSKKKWSFFYLLSFFLSALFIIYHQAIYNRLSFSLFFFFFFFFCNRGPLNVTIVQVGRGNGSGGDGGSDLLRLEPPSDLRPSPSPLSDTSTTLQSDNNDTLAGGERAVPRAVWTRLKDFSVTGEVAEKSCRSYPCEAF